MKLYNQNHVDYLKFNKMITPPLIKILFWIGVVACVSSQVISIAEAYYNLPIGLIIIVLGPIAIRLACELLLVPFSIHATLVEIRNGLGNRTEGGSDLPEEKWIMEDVPEQPVAPAPVASESSKSDKQKLVAFLLCFFLGGFGIHRFYLGYTGIGVIQLLTLGGCGIWAIIDFIMILTGGLKDADGRELS